MKVFKPLFMILGIWLMHLIVLVTLAFMLDPVAHTLAIASKIQLFDTLVFVDGLTFLLWGIISGYLNGAFYRKTTHSLLGLLFILSLLGEFAKGHSPNIIEPLVLLICAPLGLFLSPFIYETLAQLAYIFRGSGKAGEN